MERDIEEVIQMIADELRKADGNFVEEIANQVVPMNIRYVEDSMFEVTEP